MVSPPCRLARVRCSPAGWLAAIFLGLACSGLGYLFWYGALERVEASRVAALLYLEPLVTLAAAVVLLREAVPITTVAGGVLVVAGVVLVQTARDAGPPASLDPAGGARHGVMSHDTRGDTRVTRR